MLLGKGYSGARKGALLQLVAIAGLQVRSALVRPLLVLRALAVAASFGGELSPKRQLDDPWYNTEIVSSRLTRAHFLRCAWAAQRLAKKSGSEPLSPMPDPHPRSAQPEPATILPIPEHPGYEIHLKQTDLEWMAVITAPREQSSIAFGADRETVLAKARQWIEAHAADKDSP